MKRFAILLLIPCMLLIASCEPISLPDIFWITPTPHITGGPVYPTIHGAGYEGITPRGPQDGWVVTPHNLTTEDVTAVPASVEIGGKTVSVDKVVHGLLCDDMWAGTIYVAEDVQVNPWGDSPNFLSECNLEVRAGTIVYVAAHPGEVFYRGCMCHE